MGSQKDKFSMTDQPQPLKTGCRQESEAKVQHAVSRRNGRWSSKEQASYLSFLRRYYYIMRDSVLRYHYRIFNKMAALVGTRNSTQCKSHHQKMLSKHQDCLENIVFKCGGPGQAVPIGEGETHLRHSIIVKEGMKQLLMGDSPFLALKVDQKLLIIINEQLVDHY